METIIRTKKVKTLNRRRFALKTLTVGESFLYSKDKSRLEQQNASGIAGYYNRTTKMKFSTSRDTKGWLWINRIK